jgi:hypothetical protein
MDEFDWGAWGTPQHRTFHSGTTRKNVTESFDMSKTLSAEPTLLSRLYSIKSWSLSEVIAFTVDIDYRPCDVQG